MTRFLNLVFYQVGWLACVLGIAWNVQWIGFSIALSLVGLHLCLATDRSLQVKLGLTAAVLGLIVDSGQVWAGVFAFPRGSVVDWLPPPCIALLWVQFATTIRYSMSWLSRRYLVCACFGLVGAPMAFFAGERLGAVEFLSPRLVNFVILGVVWSFVVPSLVLLSDRWGLQDGRVVKYRWPTKGVQDCDDARRTVEKL